MAIPPLRVIVDGAYMMDGGSISLLLVDDAGVEHGLELVQHLIPENSSDDRLFGRLYLDNSLIDVRSDDETTIINFLEGAPIQAPSSKPAATSGTHLVIGDDIQSYVEARAKGPASALAHLVEQLVAFVRSEEYVRLAGTAITGD